jgi:hypothetical protein
MLLASLLSTIQLQVTSCPPIRPPSSSTTAVDRQSPFAPRRMRVKFYSRCPWRREIRQATTIPRTYFMSTDVTLMANETPLPSQIPQEASMRNTAQYPWNGTARRCAICDGRFGLARHYICRTALCSRKCADRFRVRRDDDRRWLHLAQAA